MNRIQLTVLFEDPFWVAILERQTDLHYEASRKVFAAEPSNPEILQFVLRKLDRLPFTRPSLQYAIEERKINPKRRQREAHREMEHTGMRTKAQAALQAQIEAVKQERKVDQRQAREEEQRRKYELRREKQKKRHQGR